MVSVALLFWIGTQISAPTWYFVICIILFIVRVIEFKDT